MEHRSATVMAGIPAIISALYRNVRFNVGDPVALVAIGEGDDQKSIFILRDGLRILGGGCWRRPGSACRSATMFISE